MLLALAIAALNACQNKSEPTPTIPQPILESNRLRYPAEHPQLKLLVSVAAQPAQSITVELPARIVWNEEKTQRIYPAFAGRVGRIAADVGQRVRAGQVLAELASPEFGAAQADTTRTQADARLAQQNLQRQRELFEGGVLARKDLEQAEAEAARSQAEAARAQARTRLYGSAADVNQQLTLRADIAGTVVERNINPGQELRPDNMAAPLFTVSDPSSLWVQIDAQEADLPDLRPGARVALVVPSLAQEPVQATVQAVTDQIDPLSRTIKVRATVANPQRLLKNEMLARARYE
ncbi:MAG: efflux RND transporter periplasmic adaptor subunit, partial [Limnohabitans sp.]